YVLLWWLDGYYSGVLWSVGSRLRYEQHAVVMFVFSSRRRHTSSVSAFLLNRSSDLSRRLNASNLFLSLILHLGNLFLIVQLHFSKLFLILKSGVNHTSRGSISTSTLPSIKLRKCSSKIITS